MVVQQYIHQLNNTELGRTHTNETYVSVPRRIVSNLTFLKDGQQTWSFKRNGKQYVLRFKKYDNGEFRITGLGKLYRDVDVYAGDSIVFEVRDGSLLVDFISRPDVVVFGSYKDGVVECRNEDRVVTMVGKEIPCIHGGVLGGFKVVFDGKVKPRKDSDREVKTYRLYFRQHLISIPRGTTLCFFSMIAPASLVSVAENEIKRVEIKER